MPAIVVEGNLVLWGGTPEWAAPLREREEHAYAWSRTARPGSWIGTPRGEAPAAARAGAGARAELAHDLRHMLTRVELELEVGEPQRARAALAEARGLCEGSLEPNARPVLDLVALCSAEARAAARLHEGRELQSSLPRECRLAVPEAPLRRLLANLLGNALRASPPGEAVTLTLQRLADGGARLAIADRGAGFGRSTIDARLTSRSSGCGSSGVGSLSVMECARELCASIEVHSGPDCGSEFVVRIPG